jgi:hypothetical protein
MDGRGLGHMQKDRRDVCFNLLSHTLWVLYILTISNDSTPPTDAPGVWSDEMFPLKMNWKGRFYGPPNLGSIGAEQHCMFSPLHSIPEPSQHQTKQNMSDANGLTRFAT